MKKNIHPVWNHDSLVTCSCGNSFITGSSQKTLKVDICNKCHPFFTGEMKFVDRQGRVDKFIQKMKLAEVKKEEMKQRKQAKVANKKTKNTKQKSYKDILREQQGAIAKDQTQAASVATTVPVSSPEKKEIAKSKKEN